MLTGIRDTDLLIVLEIHPLDVLSLSQVCKHFNELCESSWLYRVKRDFGVHEYKPLQERYKTQYLALMDSLYTSRYRPDSFIYSRMYSINIDNLDNEKVLEWMHDNDFLNYELESHLPLMVFRWMENKGYQYILKETKCIDAETYIWLFNKGLIDETSLYEGFSNVGRVDLIPDDYMCKYIDSIWPLQSLKYWIEKGSSIKEGCRTIRDLECYEYLISKGYYVIPGACKMVYNSKNTEHLMYECITRHDLPLFRQLVGTVPITVSYLANAKIQGYNLMFDVMSRYPIVRGYGKYTHGKITILDMNIDLVMYRDKPLSEAEISTLRYM